MPTMCQPFLLDARNTDLNKPYILAPGVLNLVREHRRGMSSETLGPGCPWSRWREWLTLLGKRGKFLRRGILKNQQGGEVAGGK